MAVLITGVEPGSPAHRVGVRRGELLQSINGNLIRDVLDYRFYMLEERLELRLEGKDGIVRTVRVRKEEYDDLGLEFETYLMDRQHHCKNKCIFCFVDQMPGGLRESLYFKDDDSRMSFLFGSYVTLTNVTEEEIQRIIKMHISPINVSVHPTDPELRVKMLKNPRAADSLRYLPMLTEAGIQVNAQLVLCPGINDGTQMLRSLRDLEQLHPGLHSIALVPVGLTKHREGLYPLRIMTHEEAAENLRIALDFGAEMIQKHGTRIAYPADELFLLAGEPIPEDDFYGEFEQLEDGVGLYALLRREFREELEWSDGGTREETVSLACGVLAQPLLEKLLAEMKEKWPGIKVHIHGVVYRLFGDTVTVTGLLCGKDLADGLRGLPLGSRLLLPSVMLRHEEAFLDDTTVPWLEEQLGVPVQVVDMDGGALLRALTGEE